MLKKSNFLSKIIPASDKTAPETLYASVITLPNNKVTMPILSSETIIASLALNLYKTKTITTLGSPIFIPGTAEKIGGISDSTYAKTSAIVVQIPKYAIFLVVFIKSP